jgi:hypothetical protein
MAKPQQNNDTPASKRHYTFMVSLASWSCSRYQSATNRNQAHLPVSA